MNRATAKPTKRSKKLTATSKGASIGVQGSNGRVVRLSPREYRFLTPSPYPLSRSPEQGKQSPPAASAVSRIETDFHAIASRRSSPVRARSKQNGDSRRSMAYRRDPGRRSRRPAALDDDESHRSPWNERPATRHIRAAPHREKLCCLALGPYVYWPPSCNLLFKKTRRTTFIWRTLRCVGKNRATTTCASASKSPCTSTTVNH